MRKKLIKVLFNAHNKVTDASLFDDATYAQQIEIEADYLIENGVTFDKDINALTKKVVRLEKSNRNWRRKHQRLKADAVSRGVHDQVRWERDAAMEQLEEHGIPFGGIAPDVVKVVRCKDCLYYGETIGKDSGKPCGYGSCYCTSAVITGIVYDENFCSYGEKRDDGNA